MHMEVCLCVANVAGHLGSFEDSARVWDDEIVVECRVPAGNGVETAGLATGVSYDEV